MDGTPHVVDPHPPVMPQQPPSPVLLALAARFRASRAGRAGAGAGDFICDYRHLLAAAGAADGEALTRAEHDLLEAERASRGLLALDRHPRDPELWLRVRLTREGGEAWLFERIGHESPAATRARVAAGFRAAGDFPVPAAWQDRWRSWCDALAATAAAGGPLAPFDPSDPEANKELLRTLAAVLGWEGESLLRFASCVICGNSKRLEQLAPCLLACLRQLGPDPDPTLESFGLLPKPRSVTIHGPLCLEFEQGNIDFGLLAGPASVAAADLAAAVSVRTTAPRCLSVENETTFHELAKLRAGTLLVLTSFPGRAALALFERLPANLPCCHFGDSDPAGFDILRDLRDKTGRAIAPLHMEFRELPRGPALTAQERRILERLLATPVMGDLHPVFQAMLAAGHKGNLEQEALGRPAPEWPFHGGAQSC